MKKTLLLLLMLIWANCAGAAEETLQHGRFGSMTVYRPDGQPTGVAIFVSGDGGWNAGVVDMARAMVADNLLVVGIDIRHYLQALAASDESCSYPAADFETLSKRVQAVYRLPLYLEPILVGYSSGATLVYVVLAQAPANTFRGAVSLGFCPDLPLGRPFCGGRGLAAEPMTPKPGYRFLPTKKLENPWIALQGTVDQVCDPAATAAYVRQVPHGRIVMLPKVGHGFSVQKNWLSQFSEAVRQLSAAGTAVAVAGRTPLPDLPLVEVPAQGGNGQVMAVIVTGDGGWASLDRDLGAALAKRGVGVIGLNSLQYFWHARTPEGAARDLERIISHYQTAWDSRKILLIGYSLGADVLPFMVNGLASATRQQVGGVALLGPGLTVNFQFHLADWLGGSGHGAYEVVPAMAKLAGLKVLCLYGAEEQDSACRQLDPAVGRSVALPGGHHLGGDYAAIADLILKEMP